MHDKAVRVGQTLSEIEPYELKTMVLKAAKIAIFVFLAMLLSIFLFSFAVNTDWEVDHRLEIDASPATVWNLLADFENYPSWNRYSPNVTGIFSEGERIVVEAKLGSRTQLVENYIVSIKPESELCWQSADWFASYAKGLRCRWLVEQDNGTTLLIHHEIMSGPLAWLIKLIFFEKIQHGLGVVNKSLAAEAVRISQQTDESE